MTHKQRMIDRAELIEHIMQMNKLEPAYAEKAHRWYCATLPWFELPAWDMFKRGAI